MGVELFAERPALVYRITYGWPGLPPRTELVTLPRALELGAHVKIAEQWWRVERIAPAVGDDHLGVAHATPF